MLQEMGEGGSQEPGARSQEGGAVPRGTDYRQ
jgi:hypothetical protein